MKESKLYKKTEDCSIRMDIYYQVQNAPVIVYIHGGALIFGSRRDITEAQVEYFKTAGYNVISVDYRLAPETKLDEIIKDLKDAMVWIKTRTSEWYDMDTERIILMGSSAGGYLSLLLGTMSDVKPIGIISLYGYGDILGEWYSTPSQFYLEKKLVDLKTAQQFVGKYGTTDGSSDRFMYYLYCRQHGNWVEKISGLNRVQDINALKTLNPIDNVDASFPPTIFIHGDKDTDVPYEQSVLMHKRLKSLGVKTELVTISGADHGFDKAFASKEVQDVYDQALGFISSL
ncbi:MAG: alpha/beta hydrolase [Clostridiales bacterium]|nr:alpha/beta hydrolase [Clostridiales bacterium]